MMNGVSWVLLIFAVVGWVGFGAAMREWRFALDMASAAIGRNETLLAELAKLLLWLREQGYNF
jgi:hypothetical protein